MSQALVKLGKVHSFKCKVHGFVEKRKVADRFSGGVCCFTRCGVSRLGMDCLYPWLTS